MSGPKQYDTAVIGGGLAGLTLSCLLAQGGVKTACLERFPPRENGDLRTTAISYGSKTILEEAGIWQKVEQTACPIEDIKIYDGDSPLLLNFLSREVEGRPFGWIVLNHDLLAAMRARAFELGVDLVVPAAVKDFEIADRAAVILQDGSRIEAQLIVGADGRGSFVREWMDVPVRGWDYGQRAIICTAAHENPHDNVALEHFWPEGPFAALPMSDEGNTHRSAVVFTEHGAKRKSLMNLSDEMFEAKLKAKFPPEYGQVSLAGKRACYPLSLVHAADYVAPRMALVADAAHGIHPVAGQGLNLGFRDVRELATLLTRAKQAGEDMGSAELLETYQRRRRPDNMAMVAVTDALVKLFSNRLPPLRALRKAGLRAVSGLPAAKRFFMRRAMGDY